MQPGDSVSARLSTLGELPIIDPTILAPLLDPDLGGDAGFLAEVVQAYRDDSPTRLQALREAQQTLDADAIARAAHSLKGSSGNFGAARMQALCVELEQLCREGRPGDAAPFIDRLHVEYERLLAELDRMIASAKAAC
jgi:HPt (histidine-containing phosphotransfer) domain-containing protein